MHPHSPRWLLLVLVCLATASSPAYARLAAAPTTVLRLKAGSAAGQVGITSQLAPTSFRIGSDGSYRVMDAANKRILFFNGASGKLERTIALTTLKQPTDFAINNAGVFVLDTGAWKIVRVSLTGKVQSSFAIAPTLKGKITTIALTADGRLFALALNESFLLLSANEPLPPENQLLASFIGVPTVRSNAQFFVDTQIKELNVYFISSGIVGAIPLGTYAGTPKFLDVNQGMQPYVTFSNQGKIEVRRFAVNGRLLGKLNFDLSAYRTASRRVYVDRQGAVYTMQIGKADLTIQRYIMTDSAGKPLPAQTTLVTTAPWSPSVLPLPGAA